MARVHASRNCIDFEEPNVSMQPVGKDILLNKPFYSESASREGSQCCISRSGQIDIFVTHHAQVFKCVGVG